MPSSPSVADALRAFAPAYLKRFGESIPTGHRKVLSVIMRCRTGELGGVAYGCDCCGRHHWVGRSCGNRHCPTCQFEKTQLWLAKQTAKLLPVHYFCVTFTVPEELRMPLRGSQEAGYKALFDAAADSIRDVGAVTRALKGCRLGYFGVLHTWGRNPMVYHPHVHFIVPGGGVSVDGDGQPLEWKSTTDSFLMHHGTLINVYKAKLTDNLRLCEIYDSVPASAWMKKSVVDIKAVGDGKAVLKYLAPYVYRVAISNSRIVSMDEQSVTYKVTPSGTKRTVTRTVEGEQFIRGFLQHVLPSGFHKIRSYGWMSPNSRIDIEEVRWLACLYLGLTFILAMLQPKLERAATKPMRCLHCGGKMRLIGVRYEDSRALVEHSLSFLDSG